MFASFEQGIAIVLGVALLVAVVTLYSTSVKPQRWRRRYPYRPTRFDQQQKPDLTDVGQQLHAVMAGSFEKRRVLSSSEYHIFAIVENEFAIQRAGYRVFAQTSLGQILTSSSGDAFRSINSKRVDILVVDRAGWPFLAVEYQGGHHYQGTAAGRDNYRSLHRLGVGGLARCRSARQFNSL